MPIDRRTLLKVTAGSAVANVLPSASATPKAAPPRCKAIAFDAFTIFDPQPVFALAATLFPGKGTELSSLWRTRQFEYQWLHTLAGRYTDFWQVTEQSLVFAAKSLKLELPPEKRERLMDAYMHLKAWPEVPLALADLKAAGLQLAFLSNMTKVMLDANARNAGLEEHFEHVLTTDTIKTYKPDPRAYRLAPDAFKCRKEEIVFVAHAGWDAAGGKWFGFPTFWVNRLQSEAEELGVTPDGTGQDFNDLLKFVKVSR